MDFSGHKRFDSITERDIDFFLLEEFSSSGIWSAWFYDQVLSSCHGLPPIANIRVQAARSVSGLGVDGRPGETDVLVVLRGESSGRDVGVAILIEDKVSAPFMPDQPQRYRNRAELAKRTDGCEHSATVLIAPQRYCASVPAGFFNVVLPLEAILAFILGRLNDVDGELQARLRHRALLLEKVCDDLHRTTSTGVIPHEGNTRDIGWIESYIVTRDPRLRPKVRTVRGAHSGGPSFDLPGKERLRKAANKAGLVGTLELNCYWNLAKGEICVSFHNWRELVPKLRTWFTSRPTLPSIQVVTATKGNTLYVNRIGLPKYDASKIPQKQSIVIDGWISAMVELQDWLARCNAELASFIESEGAVGNHIKTRKP